MQSLVQSKDYFHFLLHIICGLELTEPFDVVQYKTTVKCSEI